MVFSAPIAAMGRFRVLYENQKIDTDWPIS